MSAKSGSTRVPGSVTDATVAIKRRHRAESRRRSRRLAILAAVVVLVVGGVLLVWFSPLFAVRSVEVTGNSLTGSDQIVQTARIEPGTPMVRLDTEAIRQRVEDLPGVVEADVQRSLSGVVRIVVTEPVAVYVIAAGSQFQLVDASGEAFLLVDAPPAGLPMVALGDDGSPSARRLLADAAVIVAALPVSVSQQMISLVASSPDTFTITLTSGAQILWGSAEESALKAQVIDSLIKVPASYYDISSPERPATR